MTNFFISLLVVGAIMGLIDSLWLSVIAKWFYRRHLGPLLLERPKMVPAVLFYIIYVVGVVVFVLTPAIDNDSWCYALCYGALFGLVAYATYDLTNLATLKGFSRIVVIVDLLWGAFLTAIVSVAAFGIVGLWLN